ncbi:MAG: transcription factor IIA subunit alpha [Icmadophila ericetorum]|nr:transcription factor IIA subunit alpha [Icmadophila ericetorum]
MSNALVGNIYHRIIEDVIESCHVTFEEEGVDQATLEDLRTTWQKKLSANHVAIFPWDPAPAPQPIANPTPLPSNVSRPQPMSTPLPSAPAAAPAANNTNGAVQIKAEPGTGANYDLQNIPMKNGVPPFNQPALERAGQLLKEKYGDSAALQVNQLQQRAAQAAQSSQAQHVGQQSIQPTEEQRRQQAERYQYQQQQQAQHMQQQQAIAMRQRQQQLLASQQRANASNVQNNGQTDGPSDWASMVAQRRAEALEVRSDADRNIRDRVEQMSREMEGGGLMMPLPKQSKKPLGKKRKVESGSPTSALPSETVGAQKELLSAHIPQYDGGLGDSEEDDKAGIKDDPDLDDEDAINSDLDDPDENVVDETEEDGQQGQIMLCTYDKVQRVKNKWKCTLKDGVLTTSGKE